VDVQLQVLQMSLSGPPGAPQPTPLVLFGSPFEKNSSQLVLLLDGLLPSPGQLSTPAEQLAPFITSKRMSSPPADEIVTCGWYEVLEVEPLKVTRNQFSSFGRGNAPLFVTLPGTPTLPRPVAPAQLLPKTSSAHSQPSAHVPLTSTKPEQQPFAGMVQMSLLLQVGVHTWGAAQAAVPLAGQQLPDVVETQLPGPPPPLAHSAVLTGQEQVPPGPLQLSPLTLRMRVQSASVQQVASGMQVLLPLQA
jgi:hypothetical protein